jgi:hypothetical protein
MDLESKISKSLLLIFLIGWCSETTRAAHVEGVGVETNWVRTSFREVGTLFANPGQGWMSQQRSPKAEPRFPCSVVYIRFNWADIETEPGKYNWQVIADVIAAWKPRHAAVAFRVMTCNAHSAGYYLQSNVGVGKLYKPYVLRFSLLDADEHMRFTADSKTDLRQWLPGEHRVTESLLMPEAMKPGEYIIAVAVADPAGQRPPFHLAIDRPEKDGRYPVSRLKIK